HLDAEPAQGATELRLPDVRPAGEERRGRAVLVGKRTPLGAHVPPRLLPAVLAEQLLGPFEAGLHGGQGRRGRDGREEDGEDGRQERGLHGVPESGVTKMSSQLATWARKARSPFREQVRSWFIRVCVSIRTSSRVSASTT